LQRHLIFFIEYSVWDIILQINFKNNTYFSDLNFICVPVMLALKKKDKAMSTENVTIKKATGAQKMFVPFSTVGDAGQNTAECITFKTNKNITKPT
jgi:hypothetical protein